jgi:protein TonB
MSTAHPFPPTRYSSLRRARSASPPLRMEPASGRALDTAPIAHAVLRENAATREEKREPVAVATEAAVTIEERAVADATAPASTHKSPPLFVEEWVEPAPRPAPQPDRLHAARTLPHPSWILVLAALAFVGVIVWWATAQRAPSVDPQRVIESELNAARAAAKEGHYAEPYEGSAFHHYSTVLTIDATNEQARTGLQTLADELIASARTHLTASRYADAVMALNGARRIDPAHRGLPAVEGDLRRELQALTERVPTTSAPTTSAPATIAAPPSAKVATARKSDPPAATLANASVPNAASEAGSSATNVAIPTQSPDVAKPTTQSAVANGAPAPTNAPAKEIASPPQKVADVALVAAAAAIEVPPAGANALPSGSSSPSASAGSALPEGAPGAQASTADVTVEASKKLPAILPPIVKYVPPEYPDEARVRGLEGWADMSFLVAPNGDVVDPRVEDSSRRQLFGRPALMAVRKWRYQPPEAGHSALTERTRVRIEFQLSR